MLPYLRLALSNRTTGRNRRQGSSVTARTRAHEERKRVPGRRAILVSMMCFGCAGESTVARPGGTGPSFAPVSPGRTPTSEESGASQAEPPLPEGGSSSGESLVAEIDASSTTSEDEGSEEVSTVVEADEEACHPNYTPCVPIDGDDVDCAGGRGNGPSYVVGPVRVLGEDVYRLDHDGDGIGCEL